MAHPAWPSALPHPEAPFSGEFVLPLVGTSEQAIGATQAARILTRPVIPGKAEILLEPDQFQAFLTFWHDDLADGTRLFTSEWIAFLGYPGYVGKIPTFVTRLEGVIPLVGLTLELIPDVALTDDVPDPLPAND